MASKLSSEIKEIQNVVHGYRPGTTMKRQVPDKFPDTLFIGLFGHTGCGKTSLINSMRRAATGTLRKAYWLPTAGPEKVGGHTMHRRRVEITQHIEVIDNRGMDRLHTQETIQEVRAQLAGERGYSKQVTWDAPVEHRHKQLGDKMSTAVFVFSAKHNIFADIQGVAKVISVMHTTLGQYPVAVITHVDTATADEVEEVKSALRAQGISDTYIFIVANLTEENKSLQEEYHATVLNLLDRCMNDGDEAMIFQLHKQVEDKRSAALDRERSAALDRERSAALDRERNDKSWCEIM